MAKVLVVEDEESYRLSLGALLPKQGFDVVFAKDGFEALARFADSDPDLILLDLMLPGISGTEVCRMIRESSDIPIVMLTAKDSEADEIAGLEIGADDYISKLASSSKLIARLNKVLTRKPAIALSSESLSAGQIHMDLLKHEVKVAGVKVSLPLKEFELLEYFLENLNRTLERDQIIRWVWGADYFGDTKTLDVHVKRLRSKIEVDPANPVHLLTVRGLGYKFES